MDRNVFVGKILYLILLYKEDSKPLFFRNPKRKVELQQYRQNQVSLDPYNQYDLIHYPLNVSRLDIYHTR